jgi:hypothetical protein
MIHDVFRFGIYLGFVANMSRKLRDCRNAHISLLELVADSTSSASSISDAQSDQKSSCDEWHITTLGFIVVSSSLWLFVNQ